MTIDAALLQAYLNDLQVAANTAAENHLEGISGTLYVLWAGVDGLISVHGEALTGAWCLDLDTVAGFVADWRTNINQLRDEGMAGNANASEEWLGKFCKKLGVKEADIAKEVRRPVTATSKPNDEVGGPTAGSADWICPWCGCNETWFDRTVAHLPDGTEIGMTTRCVKCGKATNDKAMRAHARERMTTAAQEKPHE